MIPKRVKLKGFLCYKEEQEIDFDNNATLWMLSGLNGSGKSSIFDAVTYALFGHHRGGASDNKELINKDCDSCVVEFDFRLDKRDFRVRRTLKRDNKGSARGTQQLFERDPAANGDGKWLPIADAGSAAGFKEWINKNIGLNYETFTSSVLLIQGKADKLLDSKPDGRRAVLASIVDLERYEGLHAKADEKRKSLKNRVDDLSDRLKTLPEVKPEEIERAQESIAIAETARQQANAQVERLRELEQQAKGWMELQGRLAAAHKRWNDARLLLEDAAGIEQKMNRLLELRGVLPPLKDIMRVRGEIREADLKTKTATQEKQKAIDLVAQRDSALNQERDKRTSLQNLIADEENQQKEVNGKLILFAAQMEKLKEYERHAGELKRIRDELAPLPSDPVSEVNQAREKLDTLVALGQVVPNLTRFQSRREELRKALGTEKLAEETRAKVEIKGKQAGETVKRLEPLVTAADLAARQASERATQEKTLLQQAKDSLREITVLDGSGCCRHCGQPLTASHLEDELRKRKKEVEDAEARLKKANEELQAAQKTENAQREELDKARKAYQTARDEYSECKSQLKQAQADVARCREDCKPIYGELPDTYQRRISPSVPDDWTTTEYPTLRDLETLRAEAATSAAARTLHQKAEKLHQQWNALKAQETATLGPLNRLQSELPTDRDSVRRQHGDLTLRNGALDRELTAKRSSLKTVEGEIERFTRERGQAEEKAKKCDHDLKEQDLVRQHARQSISTNTKSLPESWQAIAESMGSAGWNAFDQERCDLVEADVEERGKELQKARVNLDIFQKDKEDLESQQEAFPTEARCKPEAIKSQLDGARQVENDRGKDFDAVRQKLVQLEGDRKRRDEIGEEMIALEGEWKEQKMLADLLGKDRLQLYLVRQAERQVVAYANSVLDRLSGGQLCLKLSGEADGGSDRALDLEAYNRSTGEKPINVAFLSGSQKFRVAVSLALGIGQYASRQHRPIQSVIIDEGFGCLDSQGRQVMIQELQNLRSYMSCILLVSHQEEFAEAFSDGYHFELEGGSTRVKRFQK